MIHILKSGLLTTVQDLGRYGYQKHGVIACGAMDQGSHRVANLLVGNAQSAPTMEITLLGPVIEFLDDALISICGGDLSPMIDGDRVRLWRPIHVKKGSELRFGNPKKGFRCYLAIAGGLDVPEVMGSASTYLRAGIGGFQGRSLDRGDRIVNSPPPPFSEKIISKLKKTSGKHHYTTTNWAVSSDFKLPAADFKIRVMRGREFEGFTKESQEAFYSQDFQIGSQSDRMGYRLQGPRLELAEPLNMISEAVTFGTIQVPAEGNPIILLADRQTTGGYPKIGQIATVDLPKVAQLKPGESARFEMITHEEAELLFLQKERQFQQLEQGIHLKFR